jgi:hypothetical protein
VGPPADLDPGVIRLPFLVDDYFVPNGCFGDGGCRDGVINIDSRGCQEPPASVQGVCRLYTYKPTPVGAPGHERYIGILSQDVGFPPDYDSRIGYVPPVPVQAGAKRSVFWAKVGSGELEVAFRAGGANNWDGKTDPSLPYKDSFGVPGDVTLTSEYQQIVIDLSGVTYSGVVSPFGWAIEDRTEPVELYIADVRWE